MASSILSPFHDYRWHTPELLEAPTKFQRAKLSSSMKHHDWHSLELWGRLSCLEEAMYCPRTKAVSFVPVAIVAGRS